MLSLCTVVVFIFVATVVAFGNVVAVTAAAAAAMVL